MTCHGKNRLLWGFSTSERETTCLSQILQILSLIHNSSVELPSDLHSEGRHVVLACVKDIAIPVVALLLLLLLQERVFKCLRIPYNLTKQVTRCSITGTSLEKHEGFQLVCHDCCLNLNPFLTDSLKDCYFLAGISQDILLDILFVQDIVGYLQYLMHYYNLVHIFI